MREMLLAGATGMVGSAVIAAADGRAITLLARRAIDDLPPQCTVHVGPVDTWADAIAVRAPTVFINCLGTTIRQAGSQAAFRAVDHDLALSFAAAARAAGARHCISVSSVGASANSSNFYLKTKGAVEDGLRAIGFTRLDIIRPGLLTGDRLGPARPGEALAMLAAPLTDMLLHGSARRYRSIAATTVARAILALANGDGDGVHMHEHDAICALAN